MQTQDAACENLMERVTNQTLNGLKIYKAVIFTDDDVEGFAKQENQLVSEFSRKIPVVIINLRKLRRKADIGTQKLLKSTNSTLFVILSRDAYKSIQDNLITISQNLAVAPRPNSLLMIFQKTNFSSSHQIKKILLDAWNLKYLDFTVIRKGSGNLIEMVCFNPFLNYYHTEIFNSK